VEAGDLLVASGKEDGTAVALKPRDAAGAELRNVVGRAWATSRERGVRRLNAAVSLDATRLAADLAPTAERADALEAQLVELARRLDELERRLDAGGGDDGSKPSRRKGGGHGR
jgi:hypothetical protein